MRTFQVLRRIVTQLLLAVVHSGKLKDNGKVSSWTDRNRNRGDINAKYLGVFLFDAESVIGLIVLPVFQLYYKIECLRRLNSAYTVNESRVHNTDTAKFHVVPNHRRRFPHKVVMGNSLDFHRIIGNQPVPALY